MATIPVVYDSASSRHRPLAQDESFPAASIPVSSAAGNLAEVLPDGLFVPGSFDVGDPDAVKLSGDQTVAGTKTFLSPVRGDLDGTAQRALKDGDGAVITERYERIDDLVTNAQIDAMFA